MTRAISLKSVNFVKSVLGGEDRVLVTGAGGWFGNTIAALLDETQTKSMFVTQNPRILSWDFGSVEATKWNLEVIKDFAPTLVIDFAFILRDFLTDISLERFISENHKLSSKMLQLASLESVTSVIYVSSGAAVSPSNSLIEGIESDPYGHIKRVTELSLLSLGRELGKRTLVVRPFSLSGALVTRPNRYAFSDLISQARKGEIQINAHQEVWRRFVSVEDLFSVAIAKVKTSSGYLNSGGELIELSDLAKRICATLGLQIPIIRDLDKSITPDSYFAEDRSWNAACESTGYVPDDLEHQILAVEAYLFRSNK